MKNGVTLPFPSGMPFNCWKILSPLISRWANMLLLWCLDYFKILNIIFWLSSLNNDNFTSVLSYEPFHSYPLHTCSSTGSQTPHLMPTPRLPHTSPPTHKTPHPLTSHALKLTHHPINRALHPPHPTSTPSKYMDFAPHIYTPHRPMDMLSIHTHPPTDTVPHPACASPTPLLPPHTPSPLRASSSPPSIFCYEEIII